MWIGYKRGYIGRKTVARCRERKLDQRWAQTVCE